MDDDVESEVSAQGDLFALLARVYFYSCLYGMCLSTHDKEAPHEVPLPAQAGQPIF